MLINKGEVDMEVNLIKENEDGSADFSFDLTAEDKEAFIRFGIIAALKLAIEEGRSLAPDSSPTE